MSNETNCSRLSKLDDETLLTMAMNGSYLEAALALLELDRRYKGAISEILRRLR